MALLAEIAAERGLTVLVALHQPELARRFCQRVVGLRGGRVAVDYPATSFVDAQARRLYSAARA
jgi:phosphonate transport system ATP-binding protein